MNTEQKIKKALEQAVTSLTGKPYSAGKILLQETRKEFEGDLTVVVFPLVKELRKSPEETGKLLGEYLVSHLSEIDRYNVVKGFLNLVFTGSYWVDFLNRINQDTDYGLLQSGDKNETVVIEYSSPNTNKPLHLGHIRNNLIGYSLSRIMAADGYKVVKTNIVNDRGIHICKSMLAYQKFGNGESPESLGVKSDRFVGDLYVKFSQWAKEDKSADGQAQTMLQAWEAGDEEVRKLWLTMNNWALDGINATYERTGVSFDRIYRESETYLMGKDEVLKGLDSGVLYKDKDGSVRIDMEDIGLDTKVLLRSDGTSVYMTQDLGTAISRHEEWPFDQLIYVVGSEQEYHFRVLFYTLQKLGFPWADKLRHLSYGMVNLPEGKMKSREGTVVDADDLIDRLSSLALKEIKEKGRENDVDDAPATAEKIAVAALHYFLLQVSPTKDMIFNPEESLAFNGNTGPYLQYMVARVSGLIAKAPEAVRSAAVNPALLDRRDEWDLTRLISEFPELVSRAAEKLDPSILAAGLYEIAREFSRYYHDVPIAKAENPELAASRMALAGAVLVTLKSGFRLLNIPYIESM